MWQRCAHEVEAGAIEQMRARRIYCQQVLQRRICREEEQLLQSLDPGTRKHKMVTIRRDEKYVLDRVPGYLSDFESRLNAAGPDWQEYVAYIGGLYNRTLDQRFCVCCMFVVTCFLVVWLFMFYGCLLFVCLSFSVRFFTPAPIKAVMDPLPPPPP
ncbi:unnamed protein product [Polarella glacialis]|uniref:Uncharacterized protein n=1 Tax=Polarella glacialis TaxID=89957 RepID=A0A813HXJ2_POLGL|nr:unnamed protein product [Polarella glacialis]